jgi:hypothetical protein
MTMSELSASLEGELTLSASVFKARCLEVFKALEQRRLTRVTVTRHGKPVAELIPPQTPGRPRTWGCMRGTVRIAPGVDLTEPVLDEPLDAELGILHR